MFLISISVWKLVSTAVFQHSQRLRFPRANLLLTPQTMPGKINDNIKSIRELRSYTQEYMAFKLGITQAGYSKIERDACKINFDRLEEIAAVLDVSLQSIISFDGNLHLYSALKHQDKTFNKGTLLNAEKLYRDKIVLLEKLLDKTDKELLNYKNKFGSL